MNERIQTLALQCGAWQQVYDQQRFMHNHNFDIKKFAELIVQECIQVGGPEDSYTDDWFKAKADSINKIKQHFGVEE